MTSSVEFQIRRFGCPDGFEPHHVEAGVRAVLARNEPLRDGAVLAAARRARAMDTPEARSAWAVALDHLRESIKPSAFQLWLESLQLMGIAEGTLHLGASPSCAIWVRRHYLPFIEQCLPEEAAIERVVIHSW